MQVLADQGDSKLPMIRGLKSGAKEFQKEEVLSLMKGKEKERDKGFSRKSRSSLFFLFPSRKFFSHFKEKSL
jgi:hypothetical protein